MNANGMEFEGLHGLYNLINLNSGFLATVLRSSGF